MARTSPCSTGPRRSGSAYFCPLYPLRSLVRQPPFRLSLVPPPSSPCTLSPHRRHSHHTVPTPSPHRPHTVTTPNANSRILGYRQSLSKIDKPFLTMRDKLCLHFFCSCLQFSVLARFVCRICLHFDPGFGGFFADKVCLQDLSAF